MSWPHSSIRTALRRSAARTISSTDLRPGRRPFSPTRDELRAPFAPTATCRSLTADAPALHGADISRIKQNGEDAMQRRTFITLLGGAAALPMVARAQRAQPQPLDVELQNAVERKDAAGIVVMAANRKGVTYQGAFGVADIDQARPLKMDSMFRIASMTKAVTSTAAMQLVE